MKSTSSCRPSWRMDTAGRSLWWSRILIRFLHWQRWLFSTQKKSVRCVLRSREKRKPQISAEKWKLLFHTESRWSVFIRQWKIQLFWSFWINQARLQIPRKSLLQRMNFRINWMMLWNRWKQAVNLHLNWLWYMDSGQPSHLLMTVWEISVGTWAENLLLEFICCQITGW